MASRAVVSKSVHTLSMRPPATSNASEPAEGELVLCELATLAKGRHASNPRKARAIGVLLPNRVYAGLADRQEVSDAEEETGPMQRPNVPGDCAQQRPLPRREGNFTQTAVKRVQC